MNGRVSSLGRGWFDVALNQSEDHYLEFLRTLTTALITRVVERGRARGFSEAQITYLIGNDVAEGAYRKVGFQFAGECRHPDFEAAAGALGLRRVVRQLRG